MQKTKEENINKRFQSCGKLWKNQTTDGRGYLSGQITFKDEFGISKDYFISVWPNRDKNAGDKKCDYTISYDTQSTRNSSASKDLPGAESTKLVELPKSSVAAQNKAEQLLGNPFKKDNNPDKLI